MIPSENNLVSEPLLPKLEENDHKQAIQGKESYSFNFRELNTLIYDCSTKPALLNIGSLGYFFLLPLTPNPVIDNALGSFKDFNEDPNRDLTSYDKKFIDDLLEMLWKRIVRKRNFLIGFIKVCMVVSNFITPYVLDLLTDNFKLPDGQAPLYFGGLSSTVTVEQVSWLYSFILIANMIFGMYLGVQYSWQLNKLKYEGKTVLQYLIYRKLIESKPKEVDDSKEEAEANINNLVSVDCDTVLGFFINFHEAWSALACLLITLVVLFLKMRSALPIGLIIMAVLLVIVSRVTKMIGNIFPELMKIRDKRIGLTSNIIEGIKSIKYLCWEAIFQEKLSEYRKKEFSFVSKVKYLDCYCVVLWGTASISIVTTTFIAYSLNGYDLSDANIFTDIAYFQMLIYPLNYLPWTIGYILNASTSLKRIKSFLTKEDISDIRKQNQNSEPEELECALMIKSKAMTWPKTKEKQENDSFFALRDIDLKIARGSLNLVIGNISSGKTALLSSILGELRFVSGTENPNGNSQIPNEDKVLVKGVVAYVPQNSWLQKKTIRENILFGKEYDPLYYNRCLEVCELVEDINKLPGRDQYDVGLNGTNLSGGQRQRISLCRALYQDADIYLLDDILSSVDVNVGNAIFKKAILGLLKERRKTIILVLSQYKYLKAADRIILMEKGQILESPESISRFVESSESQNTSQNENLAGILTADQSQQDISAHKKPQSKIKLEDDPEKKVEDEEEREQGEIKLKTLMAYINAMGMGLFVLIWIGGALMQFSRTCFEFWLKSYIDAEAEGQTPWFFLSSFEFTLLTLMLFSISSCVYRAVIFAYGNLKSSRVMFDSLIPKVLFAKMTFFDSNPVGRIIQRFSGDTWSLDYDFSFKWNILLNEIMTFFRILYVFTTQVPWILLFVFPSTILFYILQKKYRVISREMKRMDSIYSAKVLTHLAETVSGVVVIRSFKREQLMISEFLEKVKDNLITRSIMETMGLWFGVRLKSLSILISSTVLIFCLCYRYSWGGEITYAELALTLLYALTSPLNFEGIITMLAESERELIGIERINQYLENETEQKKNAELAPKPTQSHVQPIIYKDSTNSSSSSPTKPGLELASVAQSRIDLPLEGPIISFKDVSLKYSKAGKDSYALKNLNLTIEKNEKVALCGRTGSGKTTILNSLLKFYDIEKGRINFCGKDVSEFSNEELRTNIVIKAVIPQFGFMFEGTLKENLDPYGVIPRDRMKQVVEKGKEFMKKTNSRNKGETIQESEISSDKETIRNIESPLLDEEFTVEKGGNNLSNGEKQIVNFMRILLKDTNVVFLDEATSNVDPVTDELMHQALFQVCADKTLVVITHRLEYLKHYDRVILLEDGQIVDEGSYSDLINKANGKFREFLNEDNSV